MVSAFFRVRNQTKKKNMKTNKLMTKDVRKFLALFLFVLGFSIILPDEAKAQVYTYRTTAYTNAVFVCHCIIRYYILNGRKITS